MLVMTIMLSCSNFVFNAHDTFPTATVYAGSSNVNIALGNPSDANKKQKNNYLLEKPQYVLSYNNKKGDPNWVSWHLEKSDIGHVERKNNFHCEDALPEGFNLVSKDDYKNSGYDKGHMCNAKDRSSSRENMDATFSMANMLPQYPALNQAVWEKLESYCRNLATQGNEMYIIAGGYGSKKTIGRAYKVNVPTECWKVILILPQGDNDLKRINKDTRVIAVDMPNKDEDDLKKDPWQKYITTVRDIENKTGYDFFTEVSEDIQNVIEKRKF